MYYANVIADSICPRGYRLTTIEVRYPHAVHKDMLTHCILERNFLSFRAWPPEKVIAMVEENPFVPEEFTTREKGMNIGEPLDEKQQDLCQTLWLEARDAAVKAAKKMLDAGADKAQINILLQDFAWITGIFTATEWNNFFALRGFAPEGSKPRPEVERIARLMYDARNQAVPIPREPGEFHLPYVDERLRGICTPEGLIGISAGRCARISYLTHDGRTDIVADVNLSDHLKTNGHMSPFGHQATPTSGSWSMQRDGKFTGWQQARKNIKNEHNFKLVSGAEF
jgi:hypothetical protein